jgi:hypothetical protein
VVQLSKSNAKEVANLRLHLRLGNDGAYFRGMSGLHRAASAGQQKAIWEEILRDEMELRFARLNGCIVECREDPELVELEMAA